MPPLFQQWNFSRFPLWIASALGGLSGFLARSMWTILGTVALFLGGIGIVLPVLPTTPFVLLAVFAFAKGSPRLAEMLETHGFFGPIIEDWRENGAIATRYKVLALTMMLAALLGSIVWGLAPAVLIVQAICMAGAALFILTRPGRSD